MIHVETHGARIPALGLGTFRLDGNVARRMVGYALEIGYRHIDTAQMYGNEGEVGATIASSAPDGSVCAAWCATGGPRSSGGPPRCSGGRAARWTSS